MELPNYDRDLLIELVKQHALRVGEFTLASGKKADYYLDCRKLTLSSEGAVQIAAGILDVIDLSKIDAVGGMAIGADPITGAVTTLAGVKGISLKGFIVRKEEKQHGTGQMVEGPVQSGESVIIVEDVVTTGGSSVKAIERVRDFGLNVVEVIAIVDRLAGGEAAFAAVDVPFRSLLTIEDLGLKSE